MTYRQITSGQRYMLAALRTQGLTNAEVARCLGCHRATIGRELRRNSTVHDGRYRAEKAQEKANGRRSRSRRNQQFTGADFAKVDALLEQRWSPEQIAGRLALEPELSISHETIYRHVWRDKKAGGRLYTHLRCAQSNGARGMATTTAAAASLASDTSQSGPHQSRIAASLVIGKPIPSWAGEPGTAS